jgi:hypothetical protein
MKNLRPATGVFLALSLFLLLASLLFTDIAKRRYKQSVQLGHVQRVVTDLGLSDLALSTEARYTRHPAVSDPVVVGMDNPGGLDHFPSTLFFASRR